MDMMSMMSGMAESQNPQTQASPMMVNRNMPLSQDPQAGVTGVQDMLKLILALLLHNTQMTAQNGQAQMPQAQPMMPAPQPPGQLGMPQPQPENSLTQPNY